MEYMKTASLQAVNYAKVQEITQSADESLAAFRDCPTQYTKSDPNSEVGRLYLFFLKNNFYAIYFDYIFLSPNNCQILPTSIDTHPELLFLFLSLSKKQKNNHETKTKSKRHTQAPM